MNSSEGPPQSASVKFSPILAWIAVTCLVANSIQVLCDGVRAQTLRADAAGVAIVALAVVAVLQLWQNYKAYFRILPAMRFAVVIIAFLATSTIAGTLILQTANQAVFFSRYSFLAPFMTWAHLNDLFHSAWFYWLETLLAAALIAVVVRRRGWRGREIGFLFSHGGIVLLLIAGAIGQLFGGEGMLHLQAGESTGKYLGSDGQTMTLPFQLVLDRFAIERRPPDFRLYVVEKGSDSYKVTAAFNPAKPGRYSVPGYGQVEVVSTRVSVADPASVEGLLSRSAQAVAPIVQIKLHDNSGGFEEIALGGSGQNIVALGSETRELRLSKKGDDVSNFVSTLGITTAGRRVVTAKVCVNRPLSFGGYKFYQASYDPKNPRYSGILVVRNPALPLVYIAFVAILVGVMHILLVRPRLLRRLEAAA